MVILALRAQILLAMGPRAQPRSARTLNLAIGRSVTRPLEAVAFLRLCCVDDVFEGGKG